MTVDFISVRRQNALFRWTNGVLGFWVVRCFAVTYIIQSLRYFGHAPNNERE